MSENNENTVPISKSPLLSERTVEKDYSLEIKPANDNQNIRTQIPNPSPNNNQISEPKQTKEPESTDFSNDFDFPPPPDYDPSLEPEEFKADDFLIGDGSGIATIDDDSDEPKNKISSKDVNTFSKTVVDLYGQFSPKIISSFAKIDVSEIIALEREGVIPVGSSEMFKEINKTTEEGVQIDEDQKKMLATSLKAFLEYKSFGGATPKSAFYIALGSVVLTQAYGAYSASKQNKEIYKDFLMRKGFNMQPESGDQVNKDVGLDADTIVERSEQKSNNENTKDNE